MFERPLNASVAQSHVPSLVRLLVGQGVPETRLRHDGDPLAGPEALYRFWDDAVAATGDLLVGVKAALRADLHAFGVLGEVLSGADHLDEALRMVERYAALVYSGREFRVVRPARQIGLEFSGADALLTRGSTAGILWVLAAVARLGTYLGHPLLKPDAVVLGLPDARLARALSEALGSPCLASDGVWQVRFDAALADMRLAGPASPSRAELLARAEAQRARVVPIRPCDDPLLARAVAALLKRMHGRIPDVADIAAQIHVSKRTLQRRLQAEGVTFGRLLADAQAQYARFYLLERRLSVTDTAYLLGFSSSSAFVRAFRAAHGTTPAQFASR